MGLGHCNTTCIRQLCTSPLKKLLRNTSLSKLSFFLLSHLLREFESFKHSVSPLCLEFSSGMVKAFLHPWLGFVLKVPTNTVRPSILQAFCPPPFLMSDQEKLNLLCPLRALGAYVHRVALWRKSEQLLICVGSPRKGCPAFNRG